MNEYLQTLIRTKPTGVLAVDPGLSGAAVVLHAGRLSAARDFKELESISKAVWWFLTSQEAPPVTKVIIEAVHAMPGQGVCSMFNFGAAYGVAQGAVWACSSLPVTFVSPQKWQNSYRKLLGIDRGTPFDSRAIASQLFPAQADLFKRKKDHNTADAALLALYGLS